MGEPSLLPLFPLELVLFPGEALPLHIFEDRYREMVSWCLEGKRPFGIVSVIEKKVSDIGTIARIETVSKRYDDGTFDIVTRGVDRFVIEELSDERSYTTGKVKSYLDLPASQVTDTLRERLIAKHMKLMEFAGETIRPSLYNKKGSLAFRLAHSSGLNLRQKQDLLELSAENERITYLVTHLLDLLQRMEHAREVELRIQSNGHFKTV